MLVDLSIGFTAYLISSLLFLAILIVAFIGQRNNAKGKPFFLLIVATLIWSCLLTMSQIEASIAYEMIFIADLLRYYTWFYVLQHATGSFTSTKLNDLIKNPFSPFYISLLFLISVFTLLMNDELVEIFNLSPVNLISISWMLIFTVLGIILVEQLFRNTPSKHRAPIIFLCISAGAVFIFDFFVFSNALLLQNIDYELWSARGFVNVLIAPTLVIAAARNPSLAPNIHLSREFVFHSTALLGSGLYLIVMSVAGYYIKVNSGEWGGLLQSTFLFAALLFFASLFFSKKIKLKLKYYINRSFSNKYDYRAEWNRFSNTLLATDATINEPIQIRSLQAVCQIIDSKGAMLWLKDRDQYNYKANWNMPEPTMSFEPEHSFLIDSLKKNQSIFTQNNLKPAQLKDSEHWLLSDSKNWLILPLWLSNSLFGFIYLIKPETMKNLDHEDTELLTTITHQVSLFLSQHETSIALQQSEKFKGINQMTAFLTHDLKTLLSQLCLIVENGKIHKDNPAFIDDMLNTLDHVTIKMQRLVQQLKNPTTETSRSTSSIVSILNEIFNDYKHNPIIPVLHNPENINPSLTANKDELHSALKHIIQNAVESISKSGEVKIELTSMNSSCISIRISDNGKGMDADFIANRLFQPFDSTKGVTGMGIGVYQSREYIRSLDGELDVSSEPGIGTTFTITLPIHEITNE